MGRDSPHSKTKLDGDLDSEAATATETASELKAEPAEPAAHSASTTSVRTASPPEPKLKKHKKEKSIAGNASASEPEESKPEAAPVSHEETAAVSEHFLDENKENRGDQASTSEVTVVNINDLDSNKVLTRIASLEEIEPEYISYLATYFHDTNAKVNSLEHTINELERKEADHKKKIEQHQQSRAIADRQIADHVRVISELTSKLQTLTVSEASAKQQIIQLNNVRLENDTLKSALSKSAADAAAAAKAIANLKTVEANHAEVNERLAKMTKSLNETVEENASLKRQIAGFSEQITALEHLKKEFAALDTAAHQLKAELEEKTRVIEETNRMASAVDSGKRAECERDEIAHQFAQARSEWEK
ncbi:putative molybdenum cofactor biosynthesis protein, partial [Ancylostoma duodenale]